MDAGATKPVMWARTDTGWETLRRDSARYTCGGVHIHVRVYMELFVYTETGNSGWV